ncbi:MAG TPA: hypothetical protein PLD25_03140 [Chloroflexota bacterium]|nr:hypothetical protein [Chloroflexota bacterium]
MNTEGFRSLGFALLMTVILFLVGAFSAAYFRRWPLPTDPLDKLTLIANDRVGWTVQAILFPVVYLGTAVIFALIAAKLSAPGPRWLAVAATLLFFAGFLFWLPISIDRLQLGANAAELIRTYDPAAPPPIMVNVSWIFWANTLLILAALALMGVALALAGVLPILGWVVLGTAVVGAMTGLLVMHDWPPFMSYLIVLVLAIGLMRTG